MCESTYYCCMSVVSPLSGLNATHLLGGNDPPAWTSDIFNPLETSVLAYSIVWSVRYFREADHVVGAGVMIGIVGDTWQWIFEEEQQCCID